MRNPLPAVLKARFMDEQVVVKGMVDASAFDCIPQGENRLVRIGAERESCIIDAQGRRHLCGNDVVRKVDRPWLTREFPKCVVEKVTDAFDFKPGVFGRLHDQLFERRRIVAETIQCFGGYLGDFGLLASFGRSEMYTGSEVVSDLDRYQSLFRYLSRRNGEYRITFNGRGCGASFLVPASPVPAGLTAGFSPNVQFQPADIGLAADLTVASAWLAPLIASSSPLAVGGVGEWNSRVKMWQDGMDPEHHLSPFGFGRYINIRGAESLLYFLRALEDAEQILSFEEAGIDEATESFPVMKLLVGTRWHLAGRLRAANRGGKLCMHFENRLFDTGLTIIDDVANAALYVGLMASLLRQVDSADEVMSYQDAEATFRQCAETGDLDTEVSWRGCRYPARKLILEIILPLAYEGLRAEGIESWEATGLLEVINRRVTKECTAAHWLLEEVKRHGSLSNGAVGHTLATAARIQDGQPSDFCRFQGVADW